MKPVMVEYGSIQLGAKKKFNFYVFDREVDVLECISSLQASLGDGRFVIGRVSNKSWGLFSGHQFETGVTDLYDGKTRQRIKVQGTVEESIKKEVLEKFLTSRCIKCKVPTVYRVSFTFRHSFGGMGYSIPVCLKHLNKIIKKENHNWVVYESENSLFFSDIRSLGRVTYNHELKIFESVLSGPE